MNTNIHPRRRAAVLAVAGLLSLLRAHPAAALPKTPSTSPRNILLIIADDVGRDGIEWYVNHYATTSRSDDNLTTTPPSTPNINALASAGVTFTNAWSSPLCSATRAGIYTGTYSLRATNQIYGVVEPGDTGLLAAATTIAEALRPAGYESALFGKWHLGEDNSPIDHGWDYFSGTLGGDLSDYYQWVKTVSDASGDTTYDWTATYDATHYATFVNVDDAVSWITSSARTHPWMATVAFNAAHTVSGDTVNGDSHGLQNPPDGVAAGCADSDSTNQDLIFDAVVECMDSQIGELLTRIGSTRLSRTTIVFLGDNGTQCTGRRTCDDVFEKDPVTGTSQDRSKGSVYEGGVGVPLMIADGYAWLYGVTGSRTGRVVSPGRTSSALVQTVDLYKTIAAIANDGGSTVDASKGVDSTSLVPILENTPFTWDPLESTCRHASLSIL